MTAYRGSQHKLVTIAETTFGTTPATPTMLEMPIVSLTPGIDQNSLRSAQLRSHPFVDRMLKGMFVPNLAVEFELQPAVHDPLLQAFFGGVITSKTLKMADNLSSLTAESQSGGTTQGYDQYGGVYFNKFDFSTSSSDTAPIKCTLSGGARLGTLGASTSLATAVTAASTAADPYVAWDALVTIGGTAKVATSINFSATRTVNPLNVLGNRLTREFVPDQVSITGSLIVPYEDETEATRFTSFATADIAVKCQSVDTATFRMFEMASTKIVKFSRPVPGRGVRLQTINFEAFFDTASATALVMTTQ